MIIEASPSDLTPSLNAAKGLRAQQAFSEFEKKTDSSKSSPKNYGVRGRNRTPKVLRKRAGF